MGSVDAYDGRALEISRYPLFKPDPRMFSRRKTSLLWLKHAAQSRVPGNCYGPDRTIFDEMSGLHRCT
jgi:hypothetical protein